MTSIASASFTLFLNPLIAFPRPSPSCGIFPAPKMIKTMIKIRSNSIHPNDPNILVLAFLFASQLLGKAGDSNGHKRQERSANGEEAIVELQISQV